MILDDDNSNLVVGAVLFWIAAAVPKFIVAGSVGVDVAFN
jgi:hypothetical protein